MSKYDWFGRTGGMAVLVGAAAAAWACGPHLPDSVLTDGDAALLSAPALEFRQELRRIEVPAGLGVGCFEEGRTQSVTTEAGELREALAGAGVLGEAAERVVAQYSAARETMFEHKAAVRADEWRHAHGRGPRKRPRMPDVALPVAVPTEFVLYLRGALAYHQRRLRDARAEWRRLLELPAGERRYRSVWAAYMIGRTLVGEDATESAAAFALCRRLRRDGFADLLGLATESLGWEARAALDARDYGRACELYLAQSRCTQDDGPEQSLQIVGAAMARETPEGLAAAAAHPVARAVMTAYVVSRGGVRGWRARAPSAELQRTWLAAVEAAGAADVSGAGRLAWIAYRIGDMDAAERWLARAAPDAPLAALTRARLLLRAGRVDDGARMLAAAARMFRTAGAGSERYSRDGDLVARSLAEAGALHLARGRYVEALDTLLAAGYWEDAAYVGERVLTPDELLDYVDRHHPDDSATRPEAVDEERTLGGIASWAVRDLLARRLMRDERFEEARRYFRGEWRAHVDAYAGALRTGRDETLDAPTRAAALRKAARIARHHGMELMGSEGAPDWAVWNGSSFGMTSTADARRAPEGLGLLRATDDEIERARRHRADPDKRFHYRYVALEHAWSAAALMPDDSERTARFLWEAGSWVKRRDPQAADRFYKALALRCRGTALGAEAFRLHWFPKELDGSESLVLTGIGPRPGD